MNLGELLSVRINSLYLNHKLNSMASKRTIKREVKKMVYDIMDECDYVIVTDGKKKDDAEKLMDETVTFYEDIISKINQAKGKEAFRKLIEEVNKAHLDFIQKVNALN